MVTRVSGDLKYQVSGYQGFRGLQIPGKWLPGFPGTLNIRLVVTRVSGDFKYQVSGYQGYRGL